jgi:hypothetical protein
MEYTSSIEHKNITYFDSLIQLLSKKKDMMLPQDASQGKERTEKNEEPKKSKAQRCPLCNHEHFFR